MREQQFGSIILTHQFNDLLFSVQSHVHCCDGTDQCLKLNVTVIVAIRW